VRILAIETSSATISVSVADGEMLVCRQLAPQQQSGRALAPGIRDLLEETGWPLGSVQLVAVSVGPGSFTGLRVGVTTAKTLAYAVGAELIGVSSLETIASQIPSEHRQLVGLVNAYRGQVFSARYRRETDGRLTTVAQLAVLDDDAWLASLTARETVSGDGLVRLAGRLPSEVTLADPRFWTPTAGTVAKLARARYDERGSDDLWGMAPLYVRRSAAEEKWDEHRGGGPATA